MDLVLDIASWLLISIGAAFTMIGAVGMIRLPDMFTRQHAAGMTDTAGAAALLLGLLLQTPIGLETAKLLIILVFLLMTSPVASHALAQAALSAGEKPLGEDWRRDDPPRAGQAEPPSDGQAAP